LLRLRLHERAIRQLALDLVVDIASDADPPGLGQALQVGRDVHTIAIDILALDDDVTTRELVRFPGRRVIPMEPREERRLTTILSADVVDYSRLMALSAASVPASSLPTSAGRKPARLQQAFWL
jgi:hypothetical protein